MYRKPFKLALILCMILIMQLAMPAVGALAADDGKYYSSYSTLDEIRTASLEINRRIAEESVVLMKNKDDILPLEDMASVSVFGKAASDPFYSSGSGTAEDYYPADLYTTIYDSLESAGFSVNPALRSFYNAAAAEQSLAGDGFSYSVSDGAVTFSGNRAGISEVDPSAFTGAVLDSYERYDDAAIIVLGRTGSGDGDMSLGRSAEAFLEEDADLFGDAGSRTDSLRRELETNEAFAAAALRHGLQLTWEEEQLVRHVAENFDKVIVILNSPEQIELGWVEDGSLGDIDACLWVGHPGLNGFIAVGEVLSGSVNPSGRLTDIWQADMTKDPAYQNVQASLQTKDGTSGYVYTDAEGVDHSVRAIEYEEGIYYGYRYYETAAEEGFLDYDSAVVYPFGFGLSYTNFTQTLDSVEKEIGEDGYVYYDITVTVTNTGAASGKEVVQVYYTAPYTRGGIEKAHVVLGAFDKTERLEPGRSQTLTLTIYELDMASYDYNDANGNGHTGYELDSGEYVFKLMKNSHEVIDQKSVTIAALDIDADRFTGSTVENRFSSTTDPGLNSLNLEYDEEGEPLYDGKGGLNHDMVLMSRSDFAGAFPQDPDAESSDPDANDDNESETDEESAAVMEDIEEAYSELQFSFTPVGTKNETQYAWYDYYMDWYNAENADGQTWDQGVIADPVINLGDMIGLDWDDPQWITFLNQLSWEQLSGFIAHSDSGSISLADSLGRRKGYGLESLGVSLVDGQDLGVPYTEQAYGPVAVIRQETGSGSPNDVGILWTSPVNIAATWNTDLAKKRGIMVGEEAMALELNGWYGVAVNIRRSPWSGRSFEYLSEDPLLSGNIAAAEARGLQSKGVTAFLKDFALYQDETDCELVAFLDEQTLREIYTKPFRIAVEEGGALGVVNAMNQVGLRSIDNDFQLMTGLLREEWGFCGYTVTDAVPAAADSLYADPEAMIRIGADLSLNSGGSAGVSGEWNADANCVEVDGARNDVAWAAVRMAVKRVMYVNANSSATKNGLDLSAFGASDELSMTIGVESDVSVAVDKEALGTGDVNYELIGDLPAGLSFDPYSGRITGTPTEDGTYTMTVIMRADGGWVQQMHDFSITVDNDLFEIIGFIGMVDKAAIGKVVSLGLAEEGYTVSFTAEGLPAGVVMSPDGTLNGIPSVAGIYEVTIHAEAVRTGASGNPLLNIVTGAIDSSGIADGALESVESIAGAIDSVESIADDAIDSVENITGAIDSVDDIADSALKSVESIADGVIDSADIADTDSDAAETAAAASDSDAADVPSDVPDSGDAASSDAGDSEPINAAAAGETDGAAAQEQTYVVHAVFPVMNTDGTIPGAEELLAEYIPEEYQAVTKAASSISGIIGTVLGAVATCTSGLALFTSLRKKKADGQDDDKTDATSGAARLTSLLKKKTGNPSDDETDGTTGLDRFTSLLKKKTDDPSDDKTDDTSGLARLTSLRKKKNSDRSDGKTDD